MPCRTRPDTSTPLNLGEPEEPSREFLVFLEEELIALDAAFGNMCRKGRMFAPTKTWRKWHRKVSVNQRRYAIVSALAATALPALVMARGHHVAEVEEIPLVVPASVEKISKTKDAVALLKSVGASADLERVKDSKKVRSGKGKMRNRRHTQRKGPLVVYLGDEGISHGFRNLPGVDLVQVDRLNLLELAPGGHLGRFVIWTQPAFEKLNQIFGTQTRFSKLKSGYRLPRPLVKNSDLERLIGSEEIQSAIRPAEKNRSTFVLKRNPLKNRAALEKLNPYGLEQKEKAREESEEHLKNKSKNLQKKRQAWEQIQRANKKSKREFYQSFLAPIVDAAPAAAKSEEKLPEPEEEEEEVKPKKASKKEAPKKEEKPAKKKEPEPEDDDDGLF